ncbi:unnamed protein product [Peronospora belbahrii]|uniref:Uncharacterized protein n=1 Tax=Peronospora belbahrii TaxID=622444 RepID=A0ABN8D2Y4_9STRA|nr:unnamed protein product [Peronospora belbahrii]
MALLLLKPDVRCVTLHTVATTARHGACATLSVIIKVVLPLSDNLLQTRYQTRSKYVAFSMAKGASAGPGKLSAKFDQVLEERHLDEFGAVFKRRLLTFRNEAPSMKSGLQALTILSILKTHCWTRKIADFMRVKNKSYQELGQIWVFFSSCYCKNAPMSEHITCNHNEQHVLMPNLFDGFQNCSKVKKANVLVQLIVRRRRVYTDK